MLKKLLAEKAKMAAILSGFVFMLTSGAASAVTYTYQGTSTACSTITIDPSGAITCTPVAAGQPQVFTIPSPLTPSPCYGLSITSAGAISCATALLPQCQLTAAAAAAGPTDTFTIEATNCTLSPTSYSWTGSGLASASTIAPTNTVTMPASVMAGPYPYSVTPKNAAGAGAVAETTVKALIAGYRGPYAYIVLTANGAANGTLMVVDTTAKLEASIYKQLPVQAGPVGVAVNPKGTRVYVTNSGSNSVSVIDTGKHEIVQVADPANVGSTRPSIDLGNGMVPWGIAVSASGDRVYVANSGGNSVSIIDAASNTVDSVKVTVGRRPYGIAVNSQKSKVYVTNYDDNSVSVINTASNNATTLVIPGVYPFSKPHGVAVDPAGAYVYVTNEGNGTVAGSVSVIDAQNDTVLKQVPVGKLPVGVAINPVNNKVYVVNSNDRSVTVIDANHVVTKIMESGGTLSKYIAFIPSGAIAYATHFDSSDISVIDVVSNNLIDLAPTDSTIANIPARNYPYAFGNFVGPAISTVESETVTAYEYYHEGLNHYFMTANPDEAKALDAVTTSPRWARTGKTWAVWKSVASSLTPVCRFFGTDKYEQNLKRIGPNSHFYTADSAECNAVKTAWPKLANDGKDYPTWTFEENSYYAVVTAGACPSYTTPIYRLYNNGQGGEANHRFYTDMAVKTEMRAKGWVAEPANGNPVMCGPP